MRGNGFKRKKTNRGLKIVVLFIIAAAVMFGALCASFASAYVYAATYTIYTAAPVLEDLPEYTNSSFTVKATVSEGITGVYVFGPDGTMLSGAGSTSYTVSADAGDGVYECYAINDVGAQSETVYVTLDTVAPTIKVDSLTYADYVEVTANDDNEGVYIMGGIVGKTEKTYSSPFKISRDDAYGSYCLRAVDLAGNESAPIYFTVSSASVPGGLIFSEDGDSFKYEWDDETWTGTLEVAQTDENGDYVLDEDGEIVYTEEEYTSGTWITQEGLYRLILKTKDSGDTGTSDENTQAVFEWEVQHYYVEVERVEHTRTEDGYVKYECPNCGDYYYKTLSHVFRLVSSKVATCTEDGEHCYECECGETYKEVEEALGHLWRDEFTYTTSAVCGAPTYLRQTCSRCYETRDILVEDEEKQILNEHTGLIWILDGTYTTTEATSDFPAGTELTSCGSTCYSEGVVIKQCGSCGAIWAVKSAKREHWLKSTESHYYGLGEVYYIHEDVSQLTGVRVTVWECGYNDCPYKEIEITYGYYESKDVDDEDDEIVEGGADEEVDANLSESGIEEDIGVNAGAIAIAVIVIVLIVAVIVFLIVWIRRGNKKKKDQVEKDKNGESDDLDDGSLSSDG